MMFYSAIKGAKTGEAALAADRHTFLFAFICVKMVSKVR